MSLALKVMATLLSLAVTILLARVIGSTGYGLYAFVLALVTVLSIPAQFGLPNLVTRESAAALARKEWEYLAGVFRWANLMTIGLSTALMAISWIVVHLIGAEVASGFREAFYYGVWLIPLLALGNLRAAMLKGLGHVIISQAPELILRPATIVTLVFAWIFLLPSVPLGADKAMAVHLTAAAASFLFGVLLLRAAQPASLKRVSAPKYRVTTWSKAAFPLALFGGMQVLNSNIDVLMLGFLLEAEAVGIYKVAVQVAALVLFGLQAVNMVVAPLFSRHYALKEFGELKRIWLWSAAASFVIALPAVVILFVWGETLLVLVFGAEFRGAQDAVAILAIGQFINASAGSVGLLLNMTAYEAVTARIILVAAAANIALNLALIPAFGMIGAALATALTTVALNLAFVAFAFREIFVRGETR